MTTLILILSICLPPQAPPVRYLEPPQAPPVRMVCPAGVVNCKCGCQNGLPCTCKGVLWESLSYREALDKGKPVLIYFTTENCVHCDLLKYQVMSDPAIVQVSKNFTVFQADELTRQVFGVTTFPTLAIVYNGGCWRHVGNAEPSVILDFLGKPFRSVTQAVQYTQPAQVQSFQTYSVQGGNCAGGNCSGGSMQGYTVRYRRR